MVCKLKCLILFVVFISILFCYYTFNGTLGKKKIEFTLADVDDWRTCVQDHISQNADDPEEIWEKDWEGLLTCESRTNFSRLEVITLPYVLKERYFVKPVVADSIYIVKLGVGYNTDSEVILQNLYGSKVRFYATDASYDSAVFFENYGTFFNLAISRSDLESDSSSIREKLMIGGEHPVVVVSTATLIQEYVKRNFIDALWLNYRGAENDVIPFIHENSTFDKKGITVCQILIDFQTPRSKNNLPLVHNFVQKIVSDGKYILIKPYQEHDLNVLAINVKSEGCRKKYLYYYEKERKTEKEEVY